MKTLKLPLLIVVLVLIAGTGAALTWLPSHQKLGKPGINAEPTTTNVVMKIDLPASILNYASTNPGPSKSVVDFLPADTSYAQRLYVAPDDFVVQASIILMGTDRTSIHKPDFCLPGQGRTIVKKETTNLTIAGPEPYEMPVAKWTIRRTIKTQSGAQVEQGGVYVFWLVADNRQTVDHNKFIWQVTWDLLRTGVLERWAYVGYIAGCAPGQEDAMFEQRLSKMIAASVPEFQAPPRPPKAATMAKQ